MVKTITLDDLHFACREQCDEFARRFPNGVTFTSEADAVAQCVAVAEVFDFECAAASMLSLAALNEFKTAVMPVWDAYLSAKSISLEVFDGPIEAGTPAQDAYKAIRAAALKAYKDATAPAFARAFWNDGGAG